MSTILEALKKLEHDKHVEATAEGRAHDPLAPAPTPATVQAPAGGERSRASFIAAAAGLTFVIGLGVGFFTLAPDGPDSQGTSLGAGDTSPSSAPEGSTPISPMMARAAEARSRSQALSVEARSQAQAPSVEARSQAQAPVVVAATSGPARPAVGAGPDKPAPQPDPWEAAALAADGDDERAGPDSATGTVSQTSPTATPTAVRPAASSTAPPAVAAAPPPSPPAASRQPRAAIPRGAVPIESLPDTDLSSHVEPMSTSTSAGTAREPASPPATTLAKSAPAPTAEPAPIAAPAPTAEAAPTVAAASSSQATAPARPGLGDVVVSDESQRLDVKVLKTVWHPKPDRRSARLELSSGGEVLVVEEGDTLAGYRVDAITPSTVVLSKGGVTVTHRVGR